MQFCELAGPILSFLPQFRGEATSGQISEACSTYCLSFKEHEDVTLSFWHTHL